MVTISLIEDDSTFCELVNDAIHSTGEFQLVSAYGSAEEALGRLPDEKPDVVLVDIKLPQMDGIECLRRLRAMPMPLTHFLMLTHHEDDHLIFEALKAGAHGYLLKNHLTHQGVADAIKEVVSGGAPLSPPIARKVIGYFDSQPHSMPSLSTREQEVLQRLSAGLSYKQIAGELSISINTVRKHLEGIYHKLHVNSRTAAAMEYARHQRIPDRL